MALAVLAVQVVPALALVDRAIFLLQAAARLTAREVRPEMAAHTLVLLSKLSLRSKLAWFGRGSIKERNKKLRNIIYQIVS